jgi:two-component SAPR family response regulator
MKRTLIFGFDNESFELQQLLKKQMIFKQNYCTFITISELEEFRVKMIDWQPTLVIIVSNGALGMEAAHIARKKDLDVPLLWFSDDIDFGMESHRLNCDYFSVKPVTEEKIQRALRRCARVGIDFN